ncbi:hypothetical protein RJ641_026159, partial [Dillenia turbinata]
MASPSDLSTQEAALRKQNRGSPVKFLIPLFYAPVLPLIRIAFRRNPVLRDRLFYGTLAGAFAHGFYLRLCGYNCLLWQVQRSYLPKLYVALDN